MAVVEDSPKVEDPLRDKKFVAKTLGVKVRWVDRAIAENRIESVKVGALVRFRQSALDDFIAKNTRPAADAPAPAPAPAKRAKVRKRGSRSTRVPVSS